MAYALDLNPHANLSGHMPAPEVDGDTLKLTFSAGAKGVTYTVDTSTDLEHWTTEGVTLTDLDPTQHPTASVPLDSPRRFLRLVVSDSPR